MRRDFKIVERFAIRTTSIDKYFSEVNKISAIAPSEESRLAHLAVNGDEDAREKLILANLRFVISVAKAYANPQAKLEDLINEGNYGLIEAAHKFDPTTGFKFISFAVWYIRRDIMQYLTSKSRIVRLPQHRVNDLSRINRAMEKIRSADEIEPTIEMILDELDNIGRPLEKRVLLSILSTNALPTPLDGFGNDDDEFKPINRIASEVFDPMDSIKDSDFTIFKQSLFKNLSYKEQYIITKRLGLDGNDSQSFREIAERFDVSTQTISNVYNIVVRKLRRKANAIKYTH